VGGFVDGAGVGVFERMLATGVLAWAVAGVFARKVVKVFGGTCPGVFGAVVTIEGLEAEAFGTTGAAVAVGVFGRFITGRMGCEDGALGPISESNRLSTFAADEAASV
jgi:hypothetical protein